MYPQSRFLLALSFAMLLLLGGGTSVWAEVPNWHRAVDDLTALFNLQAPLAGMKVNLEYFRLTFMAIGAGAVTLTAVRKVAKARGGEESMGWVASMVMTVALMATAPKIGNFLFVACDDLAVRSGYGNADSIKTCWDALLVIMPDESPVQEVLADAAKGKAPAGGPVQKQDGAWTKLAWTWMKVAYSTMTNALDTIAVAFRSVANRIIVIILLFIPAIALIIGMVLIQLGNCLREVLHQSMDVFLPMMIAMLSFEPMRAAASNFILKYISVAFWPAAWALGNAFACSILLSVMGWVGKICQQVLSPLSKNLAEIDRTADPLMAGYLAGASAALPWGLLQLIVLVITLTSLLIIASAIGAPLALTATITKGSCFATAQLQQAASTAATLAGAVSTGGGSAALAPAGGGQVLSTWMARASSSIGGAASRLAPLATMSGPAGMMAALGASTLSRASQAMSQWEGSAGTAGSDQGGSPAPALPAPGISMMNTLGLVPGGGERPARSTTPAIASPRSYRRVS